MIELEKKFEIQARMNEENFNVCRFESQPLEPSKFWSNNKPTEI